MSNLADFLQMVKDLNVNIELEKLIQMTYAGLITIEKLTDDGFKRMAESIAAEKELTWNDLSEDERTNCISALLLSRMIQLVSTLPNEFANSLKEAIARDKDAKRLVVALQQIMPQGTTFTIENGNVTAELPTGETLTNITQKEEK